MFSTFLDNSIGVPQGSNHGPLFFLIFFNDLPSYIRQDIDCYAGATGGDIPEIGSKLTSDCEQLCNWIHGNGLKLNADKTHFMTMGSSKRLQQLDVKLQVIMDEDILEESEKQRSEEIVGVVVQCDLKWSEQINKLVSKLKAR